ncbi:hypothetical protein PSUB009319_06380 [Ralstonia sp. SET104]|nr:hypothetical protein PSUB009319_06380 [Ralstonia sp. SET104]
MDAARMKRNASSLRHAFAGAFPDIGIGLQAVVNMQGDKTHLGTRIAPRRACMQQRGGIAPTRQRNRHCRHHRHRRLARNNKGRTRGNALCDLADQPG